MIVKVKKPRICSGLSLSSVSSIADGGKLLRHAISLDWHGDLRVQGLTGFGDGQRGPSPWKEPGYAFGNLRVSVWPGIFA